MWILGIEPTKDLGYGTMLSGWGFFFLLAFTFPWDTVVGKFGLYMQRGTTDDLTCEHGLNGHGRLFY